MALTPEMIARARALRDARKVASGIIAGATDDAEKLLTCAPLFDAWEPGADYAEGAVLRHGDGLYRVRQPVHSQAHQPPDAEGMLAVYTPVQAPPPEGEVLPWVSGEIVAQGDKRKHEGVVYEAIQNPGANVWSPDAVPALWKIISQ